MRRMRGIMTLTAITKLRDTLSPQRGLRRDRLARPAGRVALRVWMSMHLSDSYTCAGCQRQYCCDCLKARFEIAINNECQSKR